MRKLNQRKINWIIRQKSKGTANKEIASIQNISERRIRQLYSTYKRTNKMPSLKKPGRKTKPIPKKHKELIETAYQSMLWVLLPLRQLYAGNTRFIFLITQYTGIC